MRPDNAVILPVYRWMVLMSGDTTTASRILWDAWDAAEHRLVGIRDIDRQRDKFAQLANTEFLKNRALDGSTSVAHPLLLAMQSAAPESRAVLAWWLVLSEAGLEFSNPFGANPVATAPLFIKARESVAGAGSLIGIEAPGQPPVGADPELQWMPPLDSPVSRRNHAESWEDIDASEPLREWFRKRGNFDLGLLESLKTMPQTEPEDDDEDAPSSAPARRNHLIGILSVVGALALLGLAIAVLVLSQMNKLDGAQSIARIIQVSFPVKDGKAVPVTGTLAEVVDQLFLRLDWEDAAIDPALLSEQVTDCRFFELEEERVADVTLGSDNTRLFLFRASALGVSDEGASKSWQMRDASDMAFGLRIQGDIAHLLVRPGDRAELQARIDALNQR